MSWVGWLVTGVAASGAAAAKELITKGGKKYFEEPYEEKRKANKELEVTDEEIEEFIPETEEPAPKKSRKKKD